MNLETILNTIEETFDIPLIQVATTIAVALIVQLVLRASIARIVRRTVRTHKFASLLDEQKRENTLITIFRTALAVVIWTTTIIIIFWQMNVNLAALMTGAGLLGIVVGFGAQSAIKDFLAGIFIIAENQYRVGDIITLRTAGADISGVVEDISVRITKLRDLDGNLHIVQNGAPSVVTNRSFGFANVNVDVGVAYDSDVDKVEKIMNKVGELMKEDEKWKDVIVEPIQFLRVDGFDTSSVRIKALGKVEPGTQWDVAGDFRRRLIEAFEHGSITIPLPQVVIHQASTTPKSKRSQA